MNRRYQKLCSASLTHLTSLEHGMISWEDVPRLIEGLLQIKRLNLVKLLFEFEKKEGCEQSKFEMKRNLMVLLDLYTLVGLETRTLDH